MAEQLTPLHVANNDTFDVLYNLANNLVSKLATVTVTANGAANGGLTTGNGFVSGIFGASTLVAPTAIRGGTVQNSANLNITSNLIMTGTTFIFNNVSSNGTVWQVGSNVVINASAVLVGNSTANVLHTGTTLTVINVTANVTVNPGNVFIGNSTINATANATGFYKNGISVITTLAVNGSNVGTRPVLNFINGSSMIISASDDSTDGQVNVTFTSLGGGGGSGAGGSNTQVQFNDSALANGTPGFTFNKTTNNVFIANTLNVSIIDVGANVVINTTTFAVGNSTVSVVTNSSLLSVSNTSNTANLQPTQLVIGSATVNTVAFSIGTSYIVNSTVEFQGNTTVNATANAIAYKFADATNSLTVNSSQVSAGANVVVNTVALGVGNSTVNTFTNSTIYIVANSTSAVNVTSSSVVVGSNVTVNTTGLGIGNSTVSTTANQIALVFIANSTTNTVVNATTIEQFTNTTVNAISNSTVLRISDPNSNALVNSTGIWVGGLAPNVSPTQIFLVYNNVTVNSTSNNYTLANSDNGKVVRLSNSTVCNTSNVIVSNSLEGNFSCVIEQGGTMGVMQFSNSAGATLNSRDGRVKFVGQYSQATVMCRSNANGTAAIVTISGDISL